MFQRLYNYINYHRLAESDSPLKRRIALTLAIWRLNRTFHSLARAERWAWDTLRIPFNWAKDTCRSLESRIVSTAAVWGKAHIPGVDMKDRYSILNVCDGFYSERPQLKHLGQSPVEEPNHEGH